jgi:hypothetical protein
MMNGAAVDSAALFYVRWYHAQRHHRLQHRHYPQHRHRPPTGRPNGRPMTGSGGRSSTPRPLGSGLDGGDYWMPAFAGMTRERVIPIFALSLYLRRVSVGFRAVRCRAEEPE